jgi:hypothetical protein
LPSYISTEGLPSAQTKPPLQKVGISFFQGDNPMFPWSGKRFTRISLEDIGLNVNVNLNPDEIRLIIQSLEPGALAVVQEAVATGNPDITTQARHILGAAILEWLISNPN